jgi:predicted dehydrogenase
MIRIAVVGYGYWGPNLARSFAEVEGCQIAAVVDNSAAALARAAKRHPGARLMGDWREVLADPGVDAVVVATPVATHHEIALAALRAGRHVLVEKPMTATAGEARQLVEEAARRRLVLMVGHTFVYSSAVRRMRELVETDALGKIYYYDSTRINLGLFRRDVNVVWDLAIHDLSILQYLFTRQPLAVSANGVSHVVNNPENMAQVSLYYEEGMIAHVNVNWLAPVKVRQVLLGGSKKMIVYDDLQPSDKLKVYDRGVNLGGHPDELRQILVNYRMGDMWSPQLSTTEPLVTEAEHFVDSIETSGVPVTDGGLGCRVIEILEAATQSMRRRGHPVEMRRLRAAG